MNYLKYIQYLYLFAAGLFLYDTVSKFLSKDESAWISLLFCLIAVFMFFFRRHYAKKFKK